MLHRGMRRAAGMRASALLSSQFLRAPAFSTGSETLFDKILIANRGEIACRVARSARKLGIQSVAVYSDADAHALHVREADEAVCVGPAASSESYLRIDRILDAVKSTGAQAVHPGYGFLSENTHFAEALEKVGVSFIGPPSSAIASMGDKIESKQLALDAGVNTIPGFLGVVKTKEEVTRISNEIGYPVMIKASAGGGGKGMRIAWNDEEAWEGFNLSTEEARSSFGDDRIFIEKYIEEPRHIEIQLLADKHGNAIAFPERECSIQRRNQKVLEESPSTLLDPETRRAMGEQAVALAKAVNYCSAGTVEFLVDKHKNFYFLELNSRLQVEHPVTEYVTGVDLVKEMIRVAAGHPLPQELIDAWNNGGLPIKGHAVEGRVYAEDPVRGFLPSTGRLSKYIEPTPASIGVPAGEETLDTPLGVSGLRVDAGVAPGSEISMFYDPMICKLVAHGDDRDQAFDKLASALDTYVIRGVGHNAAFLRELCVHPRQRSGKITTNFIPEEYPHGFAGVYLKPEKRANLAAVGAIMRAVLQQRAATTSGQLQEDSEFDGPTAFEYVVTVGPEPETEDEAEARRAAGNERPVTLYDVSVAGSLGWGSFHVHVVPRDSSEAPVVFKMDDVDWTANAPLMLAAQSVTAAAEGAQEGEETPLRVQHIDRTAEAFLLQLEGAQREVIVRTPRAQELAAHMLVKPEQDLSKMIVSPMPGKLVSLHVAPGDHVEEGQEVAVIEAMKMQNVLRAAKKGVVAEVHGAAGDTLAVDEVIVSFE